MSKTTPNYNLPYPENSDPVDVAGDLQSLAEAMDANFTEFINDSVGNMVIDNEESGISVDFDDFNNKLNFNVNDFNIVLSGDISGSATVTSLTDVNINTSIGDVATKSFVYVDIPNGIDPEALISNDSLIIQENNGVIVTGLSENTIEISTNATHNNTASALISRDFEKTFDITGIDFDTSASATSQVGRLNWNDGEGTLKVNLKGGNIDLDIGQENVVLCYNGSGSAMSIGDVVYIQGAQGQRPDITLASASSESSSSKTLGIVAEAIDAGSEGFVTTFGVVKNVNTFGFTEGAALWLSTTAGEFTETPATTPDHLVFVGYCLKSSSSAGRIFVEPQNGYEIEELHNVLITSASAGDVLVYNSASSLWINERNSERLEKVQDSVADMFDHNNHTNVSAFYDDENNQILLSASASTSVTNGSVIYSGEVSRIDDAFTLSNIFSPSYDLYKIFLYWPEDGGGGSTFLDILDSSNNVLSTLRKSFFEDKSAITGSVSPSYSSVLSANSATTMAIENGALTEIEITKPAQNLRSTIVAKTTYGGASRVGEFTSYASISAVSFYGIKLIAYAGTTMKYYIHAYS